MAVNIAQRRGEKALRRKAIARDKRQAAKMVGLAKTTGFRDAPSAPPHKASAALIDVAAPLLRDDDCLHTRHKSLIMAMVAWNLSLLPIADRKEKMRGFFDILLASLPADEVDKFDAADGFAEFEEMMAPLIARKLTLYPSDHRYLLNLDLQENAYGFRVNVASAIADGA